MTADIQQQVISLIADFSARSFLKKSIAITAETEINRALSLSFSDSNALMRRYFDQFGIDSSNYNHELYFPPPAHAGRWFSPGAGHEHIRPLCVSMLARSARARRWLYDIHFLIEQLR
ncbi:DUF1493 family protein [Serratia entomophila]|uniref:DUF1493 family protein n=1 Tax=Serratia entomophila TaxID=42906 RepID=UPI00217BE023|nr:DUF1493 family protein [Serratia entomophila]CAI0905096.1 Protein of uncharacterised function (DUF1493) [Serratia entomophila]CAI1542249.1 Protein of uncharacterised function (DUF1493) [Serratia entomophila]CAI1592088.1 Protein of uncharacterised function (DUF1493) [Serratia entomophila]CAI1592552.1 Protein of uncharacterised function (DUF1493) [Serratia entomophila]CAI1598372.1 Protein of uncharacterised function (DUF1493) [Serratia entomophila]